MLLNIIFVVFNQMMAPDNVFAKVMGKEWRGHIHGVGFGPSLSGQSSKSTITDLQIRSSQLRDDEVAQLKASLPEMQEILSAFDEMKERLSQFEEMEQRMACMLQQVQQISSQCSQFGINDFDLGVSSFHQKTLCISKELILHQEIF